MVATFPRIYRYQDLAAPSRLPAQEVRPEKIIRARPMRLQPKRPSHRRGSMHFWIHFATRAVLTALAALLVLSLSFPAVVVLADNLQPGIAGVDILKKCRPKQPSPPPKP